MEIERFLNKVRKTKDNSCWEVNQGADMINQQQQQPQPIRCTCNCIYRKEAERKELLDAVKRAIAQFEPKGK